MGAAALLLTAACGGEVQEAATATANASADQNAVVPTAVPPTDIVLPTNAPAENAAALPVTDSGEQIVARVNGAPITLTEYRDTATRLSLQTFNPLTQSPDTLQDLALQTLIEQELILQAASDANIVITETDVDAELERLKANAPNDAAWQTWLDENNYTEPIVRDLLRDSLITSRLRDQIAAGLDGEIMQVHARHILVATLDEANQLLVRLRNGEDFAALASMHSLDSTTSAQGGDLGWFVQEELIEPELARVAFSAPLGQPTGPVQTSLGYHILLTLEREARPISVEKRAQLAQARFETWVAGMMRLATIERYI